jgi:hypothetical protein
MLRVAMHSADHTHPVMENLVFFKPFRAKAQSNYAREGERVLSGGLHFQYFLIYTLIRHVAQATTHAHHAFLCTVACPQLRPHLCWRWHNYYQEDTAKTVACSFSSFSVHDYYNLVFKFINRL